jgi:hypothetical protein
MDSGQLPVKGYFRRMFPDLKPFRPAPEPLTELASVLVDLVDDVNGGGTKVPFAGYTYLGQFIDHDLTLNLTSVNDSAKIPPEKTPNFHTALLDLDHLYGDGPGRADGIFEGRESSEIFAIGETVPSNRPRDLPRDPNGVAITNDPRSDETLILAQLHVLFMRFHNAVLAWLDQTRTDGHFPAGESNYDVTRRIVIWHYQWIVLNEYLPAVLHPETLRAEFQAHPIKQELLDIPIEFSVAAFRFGHSMVRNAYRRISDHSPEDPTSIATLFRLTGAAGGTQPNVADVWIIEWARFFPGLGPSALVNFARKIDTRIARDLHNLPPLSLGDPPDLAARSLVRGANIGLPTGQDVARELGIPVLQPDEVATAACKKIIEDNGFDYKTPLWYYILRESELRTDGNTLGATGSRIVARVILDALRADPNSILSQETRPWTPFLPSKSSGEFQMHDLITFVDKWTDELSSVSENG